MAATLKLDGRGPFGVKFTDRYDRTRKRTQWGKGMTHRLDGRAPVLCTDTALHYYPITGRVLTKEMLRQFKYADFCRDAEYTWDRRYHVWIVRIMGRQVFSDEQPRKACTTRLTTLYRINTRTLRKINGTK